VRALTIEDAAAEAKRIEQAICDRAEAIFQRDKRLWRDDDLARDVCAADRELTRLRARRQFLAELLEGTSDGW
jgi:hypothetical protein